MLTLDDVNEPGFANLGLSKPVLAALDAVGYETPSPVQAELIPHLLAGRDVVGQAQTGTGKTAAFALPILTRLELAHRAPQALVLTPTRELAIQVAEAFQRYASKLKAFQVLPIYGGQDYGGQFRRLARGVHVVVGTPGRVMDHLRRGTLELGDLAFLVLDEADEMLRMGFLDDVTWIIEQTPPTRQVALFSATMPPAIRRVAKLHLNDPVEITIKTRTTTVEATRQRYWIVSEPHKFEAMTHLLEAEDYDGVIIFVRTRTSTLELSEKLKARGYAAAPLSSDIPQKQRERTIDRLRQGKLNLLVATDVAARGLDVDRISHVINYDIPNDAEAYVHRIGRTGRAGRSGEAVIFVSPREKGFLRVLEQTTRQALERLELPSTARLNDRRVATFKQKITDTLALGDLDLFREIVEQYGVDHGVPTLDVAAALARLVQGDRPLLIADRPPIDWAEDAAREGRRAGGSGAGGRGPRRRGEPEAGMETYRVELGRTHGINPGHIVGAIAGETGLASRHIGRIEIEHDHSLVDLPVGMPPAVLKILQKARIYNRPLAITRVDPDAPPSPREKGAVRPRPADAASGRGRGKTRPKKR